jgi:hypothetical protein
MPPPSTSGEINTWPTPQLLTFMRDSTDQLEQRITTFECTNEELQQQTQQLQDVTSVASSAA